MTVIPIAWLISIFALLIAALIVGRPHLPVFARFCFGVSLLSMAVVPAFVGLRLEYGLSALVIFQPHVAVVFAPALWLGFQSLTESGGVPSPKAIISTVGIVALAQLALFAPTSWSVDLVVSAINVIFALLLSSMLRLGADAFVQVSPDGFRAVRTAMIGATVFVFLLIAADATIIGATLSAGNAGMLRTLTGASGILVALVLVGLMVGVPFALGPLLKAPTERSTDARPLDEDRELLERIDKLMADSQLFTDPNLTLARLGRRLGCPARQVSIAINRVKGQNISRYISGFRVRRAAELLTTTDLPVTDIMLEAGFQSKSTFNTEFRRVCGKTPTEYRGQSSDRATVRKHDPGRSGT